MAIAVADKLIVRDNIEFATRSSNLDVWPFGCFCLDKTDKALIKRLLGLAFFQLSWLALQKARAREVGARMMTGRKLLRPPLLALAPQSDHGSAARAETEAFFQYGPPQSFFELSWLALQKARAREVAQRLMTRRKFLPPPFMARSAVRSRECRVRGN